MWGEFACLALGSGLILGGLFGKNFHAGLSSKVAIPAWQGRIWLIAAGTIILFLGLAKIAGMSHSPNAQIIQRVSTIFDFSYELLGGIVAAVVGLVFLLGDKDKVDRVARLLGAAGVFFGLVMIADALWKIRN